MRVICSYALAIVFMVTPLAWCQEAMFYRISAAGDTVITSFSMTEGISWSNDVPTGTYSIDAVPSLGMDVWSNWESLAYGVITGTTGSSRPPIPIPPLADNNEMTIVPDGEFQMGDNYDEGYDPERPVHYVHTSCIWIDRCEVSKAKWDEVRTWGMTNGYTDLVVGRYGWRLDPWGEILDPSHPVSYVSWDDCVKWCNARSEMEGLEPVYYTTIAHTEALRFGSVALSTNHVKWQANGYRLPTETEWEKAARGGLTGHHFPWPSLGGVYQDHYPASKYNGETHPVGSFQANAYGLHDMDGSVMEWCWDYYDADYYSAFPSNSWPIDPKGPSAGSNRLMRGAGTTDNGFWARCALRHDGASQNNTAFNRGFRCVRRF